MALFWLKEEEERMLIGGGTGEPCLLLSMRRWKAKGRCTGSRRVAWVIMTVAMEDRVAVHVDGMCMARFHTYLVLK